MKNTNATHGASTISVGELWVKLRSERLVEGDAPQLAALGPTPPIIGRVLMGFLGWLSGVFLLLSLGVPLYFVFEFGGSYLLIGGALVFLAWKLFAAAKQTEFLEHFAQSLSVAGQIALVVAFVSLVYDKLNHASSVGVALYCLALQIGLLFLIENRMHRFMSSVFAFCAIAVLFYEMKIEYLFPALLALIATVIWLSEANILASGRDALLRPVGYAAWTLLLVVCAIAFAEFFRERQATHAYRAIALATIWIAVVFQISGRANAQMRGAALIAALAFAAASYAAPGLIACAIAFVLAYARGHARASVVALFAAACYLVAYYYQTSSTLLQKSISLSLVAIALAVAAFVVSRLAINSENEK